MYALHVKLFTKLKKKWSATSIVALSSRLFYVFVTVLWPNLFYFSATFYNMKNCNEILTMILQLFFFFAYIKINLCFYDCYYIYQALGFLNVWVISHTICQTIKRNLDSFLGVWATWFDKQENYIGTWMICRYSMAQKCYRKRYQSVIFRMRI